MQIIDQGFQGGYQNLYLLEVFGEKKFQVLLEKRKKSWKKQIKQLRSSLLKLAFVII